MPNISEAYDLSLFEKRGSAAPEGARPQEQERPRPKDNVVELPKKELERNARPRRNPLRMMVASVCFLTVFASVMLVINNNVRISEMTEEINATTKQLTEAKSVEVQLDMQASLAMNGAAVEEYAKKTLGMSKVSKEQVIYVNVTHQDQGEVLQENETGSVLDQLLAWIGSWFS